MLRKTKNIRRRKSVAAFSTEALEQRALLSGIDIVFDYSLDDNNFFNSARRNVMEAAAARYEDFFADTLAAIPSPGTNTWTAGHTHPSSGEPWTQQDLELAENEIRIYLGARDLPGTTIGLASFSYSYFGTPAWNNLIQYRGQSQSGFDTAPWGGSISFDLENDWHDGLTTDGLDNNESDLYSVALHEIGHLMGVTSCSVNGCDTAWDLRKDGSGNFNGPAAVAAFGSTVPAGLNHLSEGVSLDGQEAVMDPTVTDGTRKELTRLDYAIFEDLGWEVRYGNSLTGTTGDDTYSYDPATTTATLNGVKHLVTLPDSVLFDAVAGNDTVTLNSTSGNDSASLSPGSVINYGDGYKFTAVRSESISIVDAGGTNTAVLRGSTSNDTFTGTPGTATLVAPNGTLAVTGFQTIVAPDSAGTDTATLTDSSGDETFVGKPTYAYMANPSFYTIVQGYQSVTAEAANGGRDVSGLYDSAGSDVLDTTPTSTKLSGSGFELIVNRFDAINTYSTQGGTDFANLADSSGNDVFIARPEFAYLYGTNHYNYAQGFNRVIATASTGNDQAQFYDRAGDDRMIAKPTYAYMFNTPAGYLNYATGFDSVKAFSTRGGTDRLDLYSSLDYLFEYSGNWDVVNV